MTNLCSTLNIYIIILQSINGQGPHVNDALFCLSRCDLWNHNTSCHTLGLLQSLSWVGVQKVGFDNVSTFDGEVVEYWKKNSLKIHKVRTENY
jgi:hypothetical protein